MRFVPLRAAVTAVIAAAAAAPATAAPPAGDGVAIRGALTSDDPRFPGAGAVDLYEIESETGDTLVITLRPAGFEAFLALIAPSGEAVGGDDVPGSPTASQLLLPVAEAGSWLVLVAAADGVYGDYELTIEGTTAPARPLNARRTESFVTALRLMAERGNRPPAADEVGTFERVAQAFLAAGRPAQAFRALVLSSRAAREDTTFDRQTGEFTKRRVDEARQLHAALGLAREARLPEEESIALNLLGEMHLYQPQNDSATLFYQQMLANRQRAGDRQGEATALRRLADVHWLRRRPDSAMVYFERELALHRQLGDRAAEGELLGYMAEAHEHAGTLEDALAYHQRSLQIRHDLGDRAAEVSLLENIGRLHLRLGRPDSAIASLARGLAAAEAGGDARDREIARGKLLQHMGAAQLMIGSVDSALHYHERAARAYGSAELAGGAGEALTAIASIRLTVGQADSAVALLRAAARLTEGAFEGRAHAAALRETGSYFRRAGEPDSALVYYRAARERQHFVRDSTGEALTRRELGGLFAAMGYPDSALVHLHESLAMQQALRDAAGSARTLRALALVQKDLGRPDSATALLHAAFALQQSAYDPAGAAATLHSLGLAHERDGRADSALVYYERALAGRRSVRDRAGEGATLSALASAHRLRGDAGMARSAAAEALTIQRQIRDRAGESATLHALGAAHLAAGRADSALAHYTRALEIRRSLRDRFGEGSMLAGIAALHARRGGPGLEPAVAYYDSAWTTLSAVRISSGSDANRIVFAEQLAAVSNGWAAAWLARGSTADQQAGARAALAVMERGRAQALLDLLRREGAAPAPGRDLVAEASELLGPISSRGTTTLSYAVTRDTLLVWLSLPSGELRFTRAAVADTTLARYVAELRGALRVDDADARTAGAALEAPAARLRGFGAVGSAGPEAEGELLRTISGLALPADFAELVPEGADLVVVPHGSLALVPFAALPVGGDDTPLGIRYRLRYAPSLSALAHVDTLNVRYRPPSLAYGEQWMVVVGNPLMPEVELASGGMQRLTQLAGAEQEARVVASTVGATALTGASATEAEVVRRLGMAPVVHLATHGYAYATEARARDSFIALAPDEDEDGLLTVGEILDGFWSGNQTELVVLSACQTGLGDAKNAEGTVGLQRAFLAKGARSLIVSLWSVDDAVTMQLMQSFYGHWTAGRSKSEALRLAQEEVRQLHPSPRHWAAFQLVGAD